jgi:hypothetical protein
MKNQLSRMTVDIPVSLHKKLKTLAIREDMSLREVIIKCLSEFTSKEHEECPFDHTPNAKTLKAIEDAEKGIGLNHCKDVEDLFKKCGIKIKKAKK